METFDFTDRSMSHDWLVRRATRWLTSRHKCVLTLAEPRYWSTAQFPDAIGWRCCGYSVIVECKTSRSDFHADKRKTFRRGVLRGEMPESMGRERWYLTPPGLLTAEDMPPGVGLAEARGEKALKVIVPAAAEERPGRAVAELPLLLSAMRKEAWGAGWKGRKVRLECQVGGEG